MKPEDHPENNYPEQHYHNIKAPQGEKDWRGKGNDVKDQGQCGSCWAFAATATLEYLSSVKINKLTDLAEQELVDCATSAAGYQNNGCNGGWYDWAWNYVADKGGLNRQKDYKYTAKDGACNPDPDRFIPINKGHTNMGSNANLDAIRSKIDEFPVAVAVYASNWSSYSSGIFKCGFYFQVNHAVTAVGYGNENG